ncbi:MAG TPA: hypothetical protein VL625_11980 [Patescibacteria group bacterium]|nr:hypothetical protein [Patescibacteria group bacterium]
MSADKQFSITLTQASLNQTAMDAPRNIKNIYESIDEAAARGADELDLGELTLFGYGCGDDFQKTDNQKTFRLLNDIATYAYLKDPNLVIKIGFQWRLALRDVPELERAFMDADAGAEILNNPLFNGEELPFNVEGTLAHGQVKGMTAKMYLFNYERGYEKRNLAAWSMLMAKLAGGTHGTIYAPLPDGRRIPFGRPIYQYVDEDGPDVETPEDLAEYRKNLNEDSRRINGADQVCEDHWKGTRHDTIKHTPGTFQRLGITPNIVRYIGTSQGLMVTVAEASPTASLKIDTHVDLAKENSEGGVTIVKTENVGTDDATFAQGGHKMISQDGELVAFSDRFNMARVSTMTSTIRMTSAPAETANRAHIIIKHHFRNAAKPPEAHMAYEATQHKWDDPANPGRPYEEAVRMTALWLFDYMRKSKIQGIAEAQSGGADSCFNSAMVRVMVELAMKELGVEGFLREMKHLPYADKIREANRVGGMDAAIKACMKDMLTSVYMGTNNSGFETFNAAKTLIEGGTDSDGALIEGIGGKFEHRNVQDLLDFYAVNMAVENTTKIRGPGTLAQNVINLAREAEALLEADLGALPPDERVRKVADFKARLETAAGDVTAPGWSRKQEMTAAVAGYLNQRPLKKDATEDEKRAHLEKLDRQKDELRARFPELTGRLVSAADPRDAVAYENIQARARQVLIMLIANDENKMSIANPNLNEAYNAYATFGGDLHAGTVNLNGFAFKDFELKLMKHMYETGLVGAIGPMRSIGLTLKNKPTAELQMRDEQGKLVQSDEDSLQRTFEQMSTQSILMNHKKVQTPDGLRLMNASEIFESCKTIDCFNGIDENQLYNMLKIHYKTWSWAQHKIHASPLGPTFGFNVDHQVSRRTPNLSGWAKDELATLGIQLMRKWQDDEGIVLAGLSSPLALMRAEEDENFIETYESEVRNRNKASKKEFDLHGLYERVKEQGWDDIFKPLPAGNPLMQIYNFRQPVPGLM